MWRTHITFYDRSEVSLGMLTTEKVWDELRDLTSMFPAGRWQIEWDRSIQEAAIVDRRRG